MEYISYNSQIPTLVCRACHACYFNASDDSTALNILICDECFKTDAEVTIDGYTYSVHDVYPEEYEKRNASMTKRA